MIAIPFVTVTSCIYGQPQLTVKGPFVRHGRAWKTALDVVSNDPGEQAHSLKSRHFNLMDMNCDAIVWSAATILTTMTTPIMMPVRFAV